MSANPFLSEIYGTAKVAEVEGSPEAAFVKIAMDNGIDLDSMNDYQIADLFMKISEEADIEGASEDLAQAISTDQPSEIEQAADELAQEIADAAEGAPAEGVPAAPESEEEKQAAAADFNGRVMAHAFAQELRDIEKEAAVTHGPGMPEEEAVSLIKRMYQRAKGGVEAGGRGVAAAGKAVGRGAATAGRHVWKHKLPLGIGAAGAAGLTAGGLALRKKKEPEGQKTSSADVAIVLRTIEKLAERGLVHLP